MIVGRLSGAGDGNGGEIVVKPECYVFDFAPNRALRQIADYGSRLATDDTTVEQRVAELVGFLPVLAYDGSSMRQLDAEAILEIATAGTSATLLAKRWESVLLVNVDDSTLNRLMMNDAVWKFHRYEDASLRYMGLNRHNRMEVGLFDTALTEGDFKATFEGLVEE